MSAEGMVFSTAGMILSTMGTAALLIPYFAQGGAGWQWDTIAVLLLVAGIVLLVQAYKVYSRTES